LFYKESQSFNTYLLNSFNCGIPENEHVFILHGKFGCRGCVQRMFFELDKQISINQYENISILTYDTLFIEECVRKIVNLLFDESGNYEKIGINIANLAFIKTRKGKIYQIKILNNDEIDEIQFLLNDKGNPEF
jgi:hypothetical protein